MKLNFRIKSFCVTLLCRALLFASFVLPLKRKGGSFGVALFCELRRDSRRRGDPSHDLRRETLRGQSVGRCRHHVRKHKSGRNGVGRQSGRKAHPGTLSTGGVRRRAGHTRRQFQRGGRGRERNNDQPRLRGIFDPLSALLATSLKPLSPSGTPCNHVLPIFTGRARFDLKLHPKSGDEGQKGMPTRSAKRTMRRSRVSLSKNRNGNHLLEDGQAKILADRASLAADDEGHSDNRARHNLDIGLLDRSGDGRGMRLSRRALPLILSFSQWEKGHPNNGCDEVPSPVGRGLG